MKLDKIDKRILEKVVELAECQAAVIAKDLAGLRTKTVIRGWINLPDPPGAGNPDRDKGRWKVFVTITPYGLELLRRDCRSNEEVGSS